MSASIEKLKKKGWELIKNTTDYTVQSATQLKLVEFVTQFEEYVTWGEMLKRAELNRAGYIQAQAEFLLAHAATLPLEWRIYNLIFPGTIWKSITGNLHCPYLVWKNGAWQLGFYWFLYDFHHNDRLLTTISPK